MPNMGADISFSKSYFKKLGLEKGGFEDAVDTAIEHGLHDSENIARREAPIKTGNLRREMSKHKTGRCRGELRNHARSNGKPYWQYVQYGTRPHKIRAKPGKLLTFKGKNGEIVRVKEVNHPGTRANPFVTRTKNQVIPKIKKYFTEELKSKGIIE